MPRLGRVWATSSEEARRAGAMPPSQGRRSGPPARPWRGGRQRRARRQGLSETPPATSGGPANGEGPANGGGSVGCERPERKCPATFRSTVASGHVLPLPVNNLERRCPAIFSSRIGSGHVLYCFVFVLPLALESDAALLVHEDCKWSNWCTRSLQGVLRIYSDSFFF